MIKLSCFVFSPWLIRTICDGENHYLISSKNNDTESNLLHYVECHCKESGDNLPQSVVECIKNVHYEKK